MSSLLGLEKRLLLLRGRVRTSHAEVARDAPGPRSQVRLEVEIVFACIRNNKLARSQKMTLTPVELLLYGEVYQE